MLLDTRTERPEVVAWSLLSATGENIVGCWRLYLDESGTQQGAEYVLVAGCMMEKDSWCALNDDWGAILTEYDIERFRASDCEAAQGDFRGWSRDQRNAIFGSLVDEINKHDYVISRVIINRQLFDQVADEFPNIVISPYEFCVIWSVQIGGLLPRITNKKGTVDLFVEAGQGIRFHVREHVRGIWERKDYPATSLSYPCKEKLSPFQVADLIVWEYQKYLRNRSKDPSIPIRSSLNALARHDKRFISKDFDYDTVRDLRLQFEILNQGYPAGFRPPS